MDGKHKMLPFIIGKSRAPHWMRTYQWERYCSYRGNPKAWMMTDMYNEFLNMFEKWVSQDLQKNKVLLIMDNAPSHIKLPSTKLRVSTLAYLPPNTTSVVQPLDQGIIRCYKVLYRTAMLTQLILQFDADRTAMLMDLISQFEADPKIDMG